ncbi:MAG: helix-turn-helix transcriptional regulator [Actinobacteria bacterium]|nr:helix-turn-helix transcriptional regulator [Actinomycetota bacterium]
MTAFDPSLLNGNLGDRVRSMRTKRGWSLEKLGDASGVSRSMLSQIERNEANPTVMVALSIAKALGVSLDELASPAADSSPLEVIRGDDAQYVYRSDASCRIRTLSPLSAHRELEFYEISLPPGGELRSAPHFAGTHEFLTVQSGEVAVEAGEHSALLGNGDSVSYPADVSHAIKNVGSSEAVAYLIDTVP